MQTVNNNSNGVQGIRLILRSLRNRNYRLFFMGQGASLVGTWMQQMAMGWMVYRLTDSAFFLGVVGFAGQIPTFFIAPFGGVLADRLSRRNILIATQVLSMLQALILAALVMTGNIAIWQIIALSVFMGIVNAFDIPTRQAFVYELVDNQDDLPNAIALNSMIFNAARLAGPSIAGLLIAAAGEGICFLINAASFAAVLAALLAIKTAPPITVGNNEPVLRGIKEGIAYAYGFAPIRAILLLLALISLLGMSYGVLMPVFARDILKGGPQTLGFLMGAVAAGALLGSIFLASRRTVQGLSRIIVIAICIFAVGVAAFSFSQALWFSFIMILLAGFGMMVQIASINTVLQTIVDDDKRGRIMSLYTVAFMGTAPIGSLLAGAIADAIGAPHTLQISAFLCVIAAIVFAMKLPAIEKMVQPIYVRKGIIRQVATGLGTATQLTMETKE
jgi:MFS family permease